MGECFSQHTADGLIAIGMLFTIAATIVIIVWILEGSKQ